MIDPLQASMKIAGSGMSANSARMRIGSENIANARSTGATPGADPYRRKTITFEDAIDETVASRCCPCRIGRHRQGPVPGRTRSGQSAADDKGFVKLPNVNLIMEMADMREANRAYEANLQVVKQSRDLISMTIDMIKGST